MEAIVEVVSGQGLGWQRNTDTMPPAHGGGAKMSCVFQTT